MPTYYFDLEAQQRDEDDEGQEFADAGEARTEAVIFAGAYLSESPALLDDGRTFSVEVRDEARQVVLRIMMHAIVPTAGRAAAGDQRVSTERAR